MQCGFIVLKWDVRCSKDSEGAPIIIQQFVRGALGAPRLYAVIYGAGLWASFPLQVRLLLLLLLLMLMLLLLFQVPQYERYTGNVFAGCKAICCCCCCCCCC